MRTLIINPDYDSPALREYLDSLPRSFNRAGTLLYSGRNVVKSQTIEGNELIIKQFHRYSLFRALINIGHRSKAHRAYNFGLEFIRRGVLTPMPVAMLEIRRFGLLEQTYFISLPLHAPDLTSLRKPDFDATEAAMLAGFLYRVQQKGILHGDLNLTNILLADPTAADPLRHYALIDTNRSQVLAPGKKISLRKAARNLVRVTHRRDLLRGILRSWPDTALSARLVFAGLLRMERRKRILHSIKRIFK